MWQWASLDVIQVWMQATTYSLPQSYIGIGQHDSYVWRHCLQESPNSDQASSRPDNSDLASSAYHAWLGQHETEECRPADQKHVTRVQLQNTGRLLQSTNPLPCTVLAGPLVVLRLVKQLLCCETAGVVPQISALCSAPLSSSVPFPSSLQVVFRQKVCLEVVSLVSS